MRKMVITLCIALIIINSCTSQTEQPVDPSAYPPQVMLDDTIYYMVDHRYLGIEIGEIDDNEYCPH